MYIDKERKISSVKGTGIQYIFGHDEKFIDLIVENYIPETGMILDLGGGGMRLAIPVALKNKSITVVDLDPDGLDVAKIIDRVNENRKYYVRLEDVKGKIKIENKDIFNYLEKTSIHYSFISAIRVVHFLSPDKIEKLFSLVRSRLIDGGVFIISGITPYNHQNPNQYNEFYKHSFQINKNFPFYRKFKNNHEAEKFKQSQNFSDHIHLIDKDFIKSKAEIHNFSIIKYDIPSTRVVNGYVLKKNSIFSRLSR